MLSLHEVYLFYSSQHAQWRIGTNYEGPKAAGCLIYINSKGKNFKTQNICNSVLQQKTLYESELIYEPEKTFDIELLSSKMPVVNHDEFVKDRDELFTIGKLLKVEIPIPSKGM